MAEIGFDPPALGHIVNDENGAFDLPSGFSQRRSGTEKRGGQAVGSSNPGYRRERAIIEVRALLIAPAMNYFLP